MTQIFAAIAADITKGTSRLVDDTLLIEAGRTYRSSTSSGDRPVGGRARGRRPTVAVSAWRRQRATALERIGATCRCP